MNDQTQPTPLNAAQLAQVDKAVQKIIAELQLKKWCCDLACRTEGAKAVILARELYDFIVEGTR